MIQSVKASQSRLLYTKLHKIHNIQYVKHDTNFKKTGDPQHKSHLLLGILGVGAGNTNDMDDHHKKTSGQSRSSRR